MLGISWHCGRGQGAPLQDGGQRQAKGLQASQDPLAWYGSPVSLGHTHAHLKHTTHVPACTPHTHTHTTHGPHPWRVGIQEQGSNTLHPRTSQPPTCQSALGRTLCPGAKIPHLPP